MEVLTNERTLTELDHVRLSHLVQRHKSDQPLSPATLPIEQVLESAEVVPWAQAAPDLVTMRSRIVLKNLQADSESELTLCYPADADGRTGFVSVLSPVGASLLGHRAGATVAWQTPSGGQFKALILRVLFQPEASGEFAM